jgi:hypothetical protein
LLLIIIFFPKETNENAKSVEEVKAVEEVEADEADEAVEEVEEVKAVEELIVKDFEHISNDKQYNMTSVNVNIENLTEEDISWMNFTIYVKLKSGENIKMNVIDDALANSITLLPCSTMDRSFTADEIESVKVKY